MTRREIDRKFDEIVAFSGVERFLDTPVKRYSSGMRVRLGFAVAAHLEPDILIVDEVLSVGDASFRTKSLGKMRDAVASGRTVILVSHQMDAILELCDRMPRDGGRPGRLRRSPRGGGPTLPRRPPGGPRGGAGDPTSPRVVPGGRRLPVHPHPPRHLPPAASAPCSPWPSGSPTGRPEPSIRSRSASRSRGAIPGLGRLIFCRSSDVGQCFDAPAGAKGEVSVRIDRPYLPPGEYLVELGASSGGGARRSTTS